MITMYCDCCHRTIHNLEKTLGSTKCTQFRYYGEDDDGKIGTDIYFLCDVCADDMASYLDQRIAYYIKRRSSKSNPKELDIKIRKEMK